MIVVRGEQAGCPRPPLGAGRRLLDGGIAAIGMQSRRSHGFLGPESSVSIEIPSRSKGLLRSANPGGIPTTGMRWWCLERTHRTRGTTGEGASPSLFCSHLGQPHLPKKPTPSPTIASRVGRYGADFAKMQLPTARRRPGVRHQEWPFKRGTGKTLLDSVSQAEMDGAERRNPDPPSGHWFGEQAPLVFCE